MTKSNLKVRVRLLRLAANDLHLSRRSPKLDITALIDITKQILILLGHIKADAVAPPLGQRIGNLHWENLVNRYNERIRHGGVFNAMTEQWRNPINEFDQTI
jgi:hypothetical protein